MSLRDVSYWINDGPYGSNCNETGCAARAVVTWVNIGVDKSDYGGDYCREHALAHGCEPEIIDPPPPEPEIIIDSCGIRPAWDGKNKAGEQVRDADNGCFYLRWSKEGFGFGEIAFIFRKDGTVACENECMDKKFIMKVLAAFLKGAKRLS